jgi:DNA-directed RNA polymerase subunit H (RpoH/RPB5)
METNLYQLLKSNDDIIKTILTNCIKMLTARKLLNEKHIEKNIKNVLDTINIDLTFSIPIENYTSDSDKIYIVKIITHKITSVSKTSPINDFLTSHKSSPKIIIVKDISKKAAQMITTAFPKTEVFLEEELMINIIDNELVPKHELLSKEEEEDFYKAYDCKKKNIPKIYSTDPIVRYYNMPIGSICKIIRPSKTAGFVPFYRLIIKGSF